MSLNCLETENFSISLDYYNYLKNISQSLLTFIKEYKFASIEYNKKILMIQKNHKKKIEQIKKEIKSKKNINFTKLFTFISSIPKIVDIYLENCNHFNVEMEKEIKLYENFNPDLVVPTCQEQFEESKKQLLNKENELNQFKNTFIEGMMNTEKIIYKYYYFTNQKKPDEKNKKSKDNEKKIITEDFMNNNINATKQLEDKYKSKTEEGRNMEKEFIKSSIFYSESIKKMCNEIFEKLKYLTLKFIMSLKNTFKIPVSEIDATLIDLVKLSNTFKMDETIENYYHKNNNYKNLFNSEKYNLLILNKTKDIIINENKNNNKSKNILNEYESRIVEIKDTNGTLSYIEDENTFLTIKKMVNNFELIKLNIDLKVEEEKIETKILSLKLLSNLKKEKEINNNEPEVFNVSVDELNVILALLEKHYNIVIFLQQLTKFRSLGKFIMQAKAFDIFGKLFSFIMDKIYKDKDIYSAKNLIILSQTYYYKEKNSKIYLQKKIIDHKIFKNNQFWEDLFNFEMKNEIEKINKASISIYTDPKMSVDEIRLQDKKKYGKLAYGQLMTLSSNMIEFGIESQEAYKIIEPKIKYYQLNKSSIESIKIVLRMNNEKEEDNKNNKNNEIKEKNEIKENNKKKENNEIKDNNEKKENKEIKDNNEIKENKEIKEKN